MVQLQTQLEVLETQLKVLLEVQLEVADQYMGDIQHGIV